MTVWRGWGRSAFVAVLGSGVLAVCASSAHADPTTSDCLTASETSLTLKGEHKLRAARAQAATCAWATCPKDVREECSNRVTQINAAIPTIVFEVKDSHGQDLTAVKVTMEGETLVEKLDGTAISLDPGEHRFAFEAAGGQRVEKTLLLLEGQKERREEIVLAEPAQEPATPPPPATGTVTSEQAQPPPPPPPPETPTSSWSAQRTLGLVVGGVGLVGLGIGTAFGLSASSKWSTAQNECSPSSCTSYTQAVSDRDDARSAATASTIGFVVGGVALAAGAVLFFTAPKRAAPQTARAWVVAPSVGPGAGGLVMRGDF